MVDGYGACHTHSEMQTPVWRCPYDEMSAEQVPSAGQGATPAPTNMRRLDERNVPRLGLLSKSGVEIRGWTAPREPVPECPSVLPKCPCIRTRAVTSSGGIKVT